MMNLSTSFLTSNDAYTAYFFGVSLNGYTPYELDKIIASSNNKDKYINKLVTKYKTDLRWAYGFSLEVLDTYGSTLKFYLNQYDDRLNKINNSYKSYMSDYIVKTEVIK